MLELTPEMYRACASRDVTALFRAIATAGMSQRQLAARVRMSQSEISEIMAGRQVSSYSVLLRIAEGLDIERGIMGLAYTNGPEPEPEIDVDVLRRQLLTLGSWALFGQAVLGEPGSLPAVRGKTPLPQRVGSRDVEQVAAVTEHLRALDRQYGGGGVYAAAHAHALHAEQLMPLSSTEAVRAQLAGAVADAHCLAAWAAYDMVDTGKSLAHYGRALTHSDHAPLRAARVLYSVASTELNFGDSNHALKLLQLARLRLEDMSRPHPITAFALAAQARAYAALGYPDPIGDLLRKAFDVYAAASQTRNWPQECLPSIWSQEHLLSIAGLAQLAAGQLETAAATLTVLLRQPPAGASRATAGDLTRLATIYLRIGEIDRGVTAGHHALSAIEAVPGSVRLAHRLIPLQQEAASRRNSSCQDLAKVAQTQLNR